MNRNFTCIFLAGILAVAVCRSSFSQENKAGINAGEIHGNIQLDAQYYNPDSSIGTNPVPEKMGMNGFANFIYTNGNFTAGLRYESYLNPLQGYDPRYKGTGIPYRFASYRAGELEVTAGSFYEQFGSGLTLRAYEEKGLGIDNAFDGMRLKYAANGFYLKGLIGKQRSFFSEGPGIARGFDGEIHLSEAVKKWNESRARVVIGGSFVSKFQEGDQIVYQSGTLNVPENVSAAAGRLSVSRGRVKVTGEYAYKINDPSAFNNYIYKPGEALLINGNYAVKGFAVSLGAKRTDNFSFKSDRTAAGNDLNINFVPSLSRQHTYSLFAFYPYATQLNGEMAYRAEIGKNFKKETPLGGKYGLDFTVNYSGARALDIRPYPPSDSSRMGYSSSYGRDIRELFSPKKPKWNSADSSVYFQDLNVEVSKKLTPKFKLLLLYAYQAYNKDIIQGVHGYGTIYSSIGMAEFTWKLARERSVRWEIQHLSTRQDQKNWAMSLLEIGLNEHWLLSATDMYNYGNEDPGKRFHYFNFTLVYVKNAMRVSLGYGRQRAGIFCVGGVCRYVPATNGVMLSVTSSF